MKKVFLLFALPLFSLMIPAKKKIKLFIAGDSTASIKDVKAFPETGWGMPFVHFWDSTVTVVNKAKNGRSTSSFQTEGLWKSIMDEASEGDYVFIQFGHNDEVPTKKTATTPEQFKNNLKKFVTETRERKAVPVLLTSMARRKFDSTGKIIGTHDEYMKITRAVATEEKVVLLDMDVITQQLYQQFGPDNSAFLFMQLKPGEHPNHPQGKDDNTHFNEFGARLVAQLILKEIRTQLPELATRIVNAKE
ncbi:rhamnogalacturonan acetylesterase [Lacibacter sp.]|uniref:rhamnogalacturonan acetylesterase n=1 Tax=Lacibacter sp. TaxID=1915409 RepID=UPI002B4ADA71|nr:rhamnogalacturonan acetylesterase [Lacibacter sp.]HLP39858.1 rhamnogalacturonan acetylesterase [Lacibacter sp.]